MPRQPEFLNCPAYLSSDGAARCGLPAEVVVRYTMESTDGPLESATIRCPRGHHFNGPIESLTVPEQPAVPSAGLPNPLTRPGPGDQAAHPALATWIPAGHVGLRAAPSRRRTIT